jgi:hypothetical protein
MKMSHKSDELKKKKKKGGVHKSGTYGWKLKGQINYFLATFRSGYYFPLKLATYINPPPFLFFF